MGRAQLRWKAGSGLAFPATTSAWPDATNTGVPAGTSLTPLVGDQTLSTPGQVLQDKDISGNVTVNASGCTIRRCRIARTNDLVVINNAGTGAPLLIEDCEILGNDSNSTGISDRNFIARRCNIYGVENGFDIAANATIEDCYVHDLFNGGAAHADGAQVNDAADNVTFSHNTIFCVDPGLVLGTSCIIMPNVAVGGASNVTVDNNLMGGGAFCLYGVQGGTGTNLTITRNRITTQFAANGGEFGPWTDASDEAVVSDNRWYDGPNAGQLLT